MDDFSRRDFLKACASVGSAAMLATRLRQVTRGAMTAFAPTQIAGLYSWHRGDLGTYQTSGGSAAGADGDPIGEWQDQSGNGYHLAQSTAGNRPTLQTNELNGHPVVRCDGSNDRLQAALASDWTFLHDGSDFLVLVVWKTTSDSPNADFGLLDTGGMSTTDTGFALYTTDTTPYFSTIRATVEKGIIFNNAALAAPIPGSVSMGTWHVTAVYRRAGGDLTIQNDGHWGGDDTSAYSSPDAGDPDAPLTVGARRDGTFPLAGDIAEIIVYNTSVSAADYLTLLQYLKARYRLRKLRWFGAASTLVSDGTHNAFPSICIAANGDILVSYRKASGHSAVDGEIVLRRSIDDGATWGGEVTLLSSASWDYRFAGLTTLSTGRIIAEVGRRTTAPAEVTNGTTVIYSDDDGETWSAEIAVTNAYTSWAREGGRILEMPNGDLYCPLYGQDSGDTGANARIRLSKSTDGGDTWAHHVQIVAATNGWYEPGLVYDAESDVLRCLIRLNSTAIYLSTSDGTAASWTAPAQIAEWAEGLQAPTRLVSGEFLSVVRSDQTQFYMSLFYSADGVHWQDGHLCEDSPAGAYGVYGAVAEDTRGIFVTYATENSAQTVAGVMFAAAA